MTTNDVQTTMKQGMEKTIEVLKGNVLKVRTGRANASMLDGIRADYYGTPTALSQMAQINVPEPKMIVIQPWEPNVLGDIEKAILKSDIGITPINDGKIIRLKIPDLTEERRKVLAKQVNGIAEEARVAVRQHRRDAMDKVKGLLKDKAIGEDDNKKAGELVQKVTDEYIAKIDKMAADKEKELMTI